MRPSAARALSSRRFRALFDGVVELDAQTRAARIEGASSPRSKPGSRQQRAIEALVTLGRLKPPRPTAP
jgi:hypothetical protein